MILATHGALALGGHGAYIAGECALVLCGGVMWRYIRRGWDWFGQFTRARALAEIFGWRDALAGVAVAGAAWLNSWRLPWILLGGIAGYCFFAAARYLWNSSNMAAPVAAPGPARGLPDLMPMTTFLRAAQRRGWRFQDPNSMLVGFVKNLEEDAANGMPRLYGVEVNTGTQAELAGPRVPIPAEHWRRYHVDMVACFDIDPKNGHVVRVKENNDTTRSYLLTHETGYVKLHVLAADAANWIDESLVPFEEAARRAYDMTRNTEVAYAAETSGGGGVLTWYGHALWDRLPIFGVWPPATWLEEIPREDRNQYFMRMDGGQIVLVDNYKKGRFERIMVRGADLGPALQSIKELADSFNSAKTRSG